MAYHPVKLQTTSSSLPTLPQYHEALQNPHIHFDDLTLKHAKTDKDDRGIPNVISGGFALTYKLSDGNTTYAVRCFHKPVTDRQERQAAISDFIQANPRNFFIPFKYSPSGILVAGNRYPIVYMKWVEGDVLSTYLFKNYRESGRIRAISEDFQKVVRELDSLRISHGDLSAANIMIADQRVILIDYDGMYVPALNGRDANELGSIYFQHPARKAHHFGPNLDRFSSIVIYLALEAISRRPTLRDQFESTDGILFRREDFIEPDTSKLLREISKIDGLQNSIERFRLICKTDFNNIPSLVRFLSPESIVISPAKSNIDVRRVVFQFPVLDGENEKILLNNLGEKVEVIGQFVHSHWGQTYRGGEYLFLNFGRFPRQSFTAVFWSKCLDIFLNSGIDPEKEYLNEWVGIHGMILDYQGKPQIIINSPADIEHFKNESEAKEKIRQYQEFKDFEKRDNAQADEHLRHPEKKPEPPESSRRPPGNLSTSGLGTKKSIDKPSVSDDTASVVIVKPPPSLGASAPIISTGTPVATVGQTYHGSTPKPVAPPSNLGAPFTIPPSLELTPKPPNKPLPKSLGPSIVSKAHASQVSTTKEEKPFGIQFQKMKLFIIRLLLKVREFLPKKIDNLSILLIVSSIFFVIIILLSTFFFLALIMLYLFSDLVQNSSATANLVYLFPVVFIY